MVKLILGLFILVSSTSFGQVLSGGIVDEGRNMISDMPFVIESILDGYCIYQLSVDRKGKVTSARLVETNLKSTPAKYEIRNYTLKFKFTPGTHYPKFHHALVKVTTVQKKKVIQK